MSDFGAGFCEKQFLKSIISWHQSSFFMRRTLLVLCTTVEPECRRRCCSAASDIVSFLCCGALRRDGSLPIGQSDIVDRILD